MIDWWFWMPVIVGGALAGGSTGMMGVYIVGMRIPFIGICVSHAALAGAVFGSLLGLQGQLLLLPALAAAIIVALVLGLMNQQRLKPDDNLIMGVLFSLTMGLAFLGIGLFSVFGRSDNDVRNLLWGSLMFCRWRDVGLMAATAGAMVGFSTLFGKEMRAIMFCRIQASAAGIHTTLVWTAFLVLTSVVLTVNFQTVGGLMIYSLLSCPAIAAFQLVRGCRPALWVSSLLGAACGVGGFFIAALTDLPAGATTVILASLIVPLAFALKRLQQRRPAASHHAPPA
jgi:manganese/iron transport system permease protein